MSDPTPQAKSIFLAALDRYRPEDWPAFLDQACAGDAALRAEVERLLQARAELGPFHEEARTAPAPTTDDSGGESAGAVVGPYKLLQEIGEGGMGTVWMAEQIEPVRRRVALKIIKAGMDSRQVVARFEAERQALALMDHPNIAKVLDASTTARGRPYFVMELVKGVPITKYSDEHRLTPRQRLELFIPVCQAIQHAHQKGIIHRDIKPSNVLVAPYDGKPVVKVIDFGIAKATGQRLTDKTLFTEFGAVVGTLEYMSPEQAELNNQDIDTRSDIYALGVLLYELLTGTTPLDRGRLKQAAMLEVLRLIREEEPPRPSTRLSTTEHLPSIAANRGLEPKKLSGLVRGELDWIVMKALEKDRNRRYETANAFAMDVQRYLADEPVLACPPSAGYRLRKFVRRNKRPVLAASVILILLVAAVVGTAAGLLRALAAERHVRAERDEKEEARRQTRQALDTMTDEVVEELLGHQVQLTDRYREFLKKVLAYHAVFAAAKGDDPEGRRSRAEGYFRVGRIRYSLGELGEAEAAYREALNLQKQLADDFPDEPDYRHDRAVSYLHLGMLLSDVTRPAEAEAAYREAVAICQQLTAHSARVEFRQDLAKAQTNLGSQLLFSGRLDQAEALFRHALAIDQQLAREFPERIEYLQGVASSYHDLAYLLSQTPRKKEAETACQEAMAVGQELAARFRTRPEFRDGLAKNYMTLGVLLQTSGRPKEAEAAWRQAITLFRQLAAEFPARPDFRMELALSQNNLGKLLYNARRLPEAEQVWGETLALFRRLANEITTRPDYRFEVVVGFHNLGMVFDTTGRRKQAEEAWREAVAVARKLVHDYPAPTAYRQQLVVTYGHLAHLLGETGRPEEADAAWRELLEIARPLAADQTFAAVIRYEYGTALENMKGRQDDAEREYREALRLKSNYAEPHLRIGNLRKARGRLDEAAAEFRAALRSVPDYPEVRVNLGNLLAETGRTEEAIAEYRKALGTRRPFPEAYKAHNGLGNALRAKGRNEEAIAEYRAALRLKPDFADAHYALGNVYFPERLDDAIAEYRAALRINKDYAEAHTNLGNCLATRGDLDGAIAEYRTALGINKNFFEGHLNLGVALRLKGRPDDAIAECQEATRIRPDQAGAHVELGLALQDRGRLKNAIAAFHTAVRLGDTNPAAQEHLRQAERLARLDERLPAVLAGKDRPKDAAEAIGFARLCRPPYRGQHVAAVRLFDQAFAADPKRAEALETEDRYNAACSAALAATGRGQDAAGLDEKERARLRGRALAWLRAELAAWRRALETDPGRAVVAANVLRRWQTDEDFLSVRGPEALAKLPEAERQPWQKLWGDVAALQARAQAKSPKK